MTNKILKKKFVKMIFRIYIALLISIIYFPLTIVWGKYIVYKKPNIHFIPWESTIEMYKKCGLDEVIENIGGNLLLLAPLIFLYAITLKS